MGNRERQPGLPFMRKFQLASGPDLGELRNGCVPDGSDVHGDFYYGAQLHGTMMVSKGRDDGGEGF